MKQRELFTEDEKELFYKVTGTRLKQHLVSEDRFQEINMKINCDSNSFLNKCIKA